MVIMAMVLTKEQKVKIFHYAMDVARLHAMSGSEKATPDEVLTDIFTAVCTCCETHELDIFKNIPFGD